MYVGLHLFAEAFYRTIHERTPLLSSVEQDDAYSHTADHYYSPEGNQKYMYAHPKSKVLDNK